MSGHGLFWGAATGERGTADDPAHENQKLVSINTGVNVRFGACLAISGDYALAGTEKGEARTRPWLI